MKHFITTLVFRIQKSLSSDAVNATMVQFHDLLMKLGVPPPYPDAEKLAISVVTGIFTLILYFLLFGKRHRRRRWELQKSLLDAKKRMQILEDKLAEIESDGEDDVKKPQVRIWMDGAFDMMHYGHMNAFRQGRALGTYLVVGVNDDRSITECKGAPPVMNDEERIAAVEGCKFVDEVERHCPYIMNEEYLTKMIKKHNLDYIVHGDDPCIVDGVDAYAISKSRGMYRSIPRTEGVSTSDILGRMLVLHKSHHTHDYDGTGHLSSKVRLARPSKFLTTNRMLRLFSSGNRDPPASAKIVYMDGAFDLFHAGHVKTLEDGKKEGDYLIVGVHNDSIVNKYRGLNYPIMNLHERVLSVLGCKFVDDVLIDAPWEITREMIAGLNISVVVRGTHREITSRERDGEIPVDQHYKIPKELGIYKEIPSRLDLTVAEIARRININRDRLEKKFTKKMEDEGNYYNERYAHVPKTQ